MSPISRLLVILSFLASPAALVAQGPERAECAHDREALLALDIVAFDQTEGRGWRPLHDAKCYREAAELLRDYRARHGDELDPVNPRDRMILNILVWHEAQMWAFDGRNDLALPMFETTYQEGEGASNQAWNLYVTGTLAFLRRNRPALEAAIAELVDIPRPPGWDDAVGADGQPISLPWPQNLGVLQGLLRCWDEPYTVAYVCREIPKLR